MGHAMTAALQKPPPAPGPRRWTRDEYYRLAQLGLFADQRVMLLDGEIFQMAAHGHLHVVTVIRVSDLLNRVFGTGFWVRSQAPLNVGRDSDPEPDVAVVRGAMSDYTDHPTSAVLVVEVSDAEPSVDRRKAGIYASGSVEDYWLLNLPRRRLEVYRGPVADDEAVYGFRYAERRDYGEVDAITPLALPNVQIRVADLLG